MEFGTPFGIFLGTVGTTMCHSNETQPNQPTKRLGVHESNFDGNESTIQFGVPMILMPEMHLAIFECTTGFQKCTSKKKTPFGSSNLLGISCNSSLQTSLTWTCCAFASTRRLSAEPTASPARANPRNKWVDQQKWRSAPKNRQKWDLAKTKWRFTARENVPQHGFLSGHARNKATWFITMISWATPGTKWVPHIYSPVSFCCPISSETLGFHGFRDTVGPWFPDVTTLKPGQKRPDLNASGCCHSWMMWDLSKFLSRFWTLKLPWTYLPTGPTPIGTCRSEGLQGHFRCRDGTITLQFVQVAFGSD